MLVVISSTVPIFASTIGLNINNQEVEVAVAPIIKKGVTLVPLRVISENLGAKVGWNKEKQQVTLIKDEIEMILTIGSQQVIVNGENKLLPQSAQIINDATMLPIRFISEALKCQVQHDQGSDTIFITSEGIAADIPDTSNWRKTVIEEPKIINGVPYLTDVQVEKAFNATFIKHGNAHKIVKGDIQIIFYLANEPQGPRVNRRYIPWDKTVVKVQGAYAFYYPLDFVAKYFNGTYRYDESTKSLMVIDKGYVEPDQLVDTQYNTIKGYIKWADGTPASDITVTLFPFYALDNGQFASWILSTPDNQYPKADYPRVIEVKTDKDGYYEFKPINTDIMPYMDINIIFTKDGKSYTTSLGSEMGSMINPVLGETPHVSTKRVQYPVMYIHPNWAS